MDQIDTCFKLFASFLTNRSIKTQQNFESKFGNGDGIHINIPKYASAERDCSKIHYLRITYPRKAA